MARAFQRTSRSSRRNAFKFAPSCFELTDIDGERCIYHTGSTTSSSGQLPVDEWVTTDASAALESTTSAQNACQLLTIYIYSHRGPAARNAVRSYNRHHVINPPSTSLPYPARLPRGSDQVDPRHGRSREVPDVVDRMSELTGLRGRRQTSSSLAGLDYGGAVCVQTPRELTATRDVKDKQIIGS